MSSAATLRAQSSAESSNISKRRSRGYNHTAGAEHFSEAGEDMSEEEALSDAEAEHNPEGPMVSRRQKQRMRRKLGRVLQGEALQHAVETVTTLPHPSLRRPKAKAQTSACEEDGRRSNGQQKKSKPEVAGRSGSEYLTVSLSAMLHASAMRDLKEALEGVNTEFQVQQLTWQNGAVDGSPEADPHLQAAMGAEIQSALQRASADPLAAITSLCQCYQRRQLPWWNFPSLSSSLCEALQGAADALEYYRRSNDLSSFTFSSGRTAETVALDGSCTASERQELQNLLETSHLKECDAFSIKSALGLSTEQAGHTKIGTCQQKPSDSSEPICNSGLPLTRRRKSPLLPGMKLKVKNTFLQVTGLNTLSGDEDDDRPHSHCSSSQRSSSVPPYCS
jgi:hypothetical protein